MVIVLYASDRSVSSQSIKLARTRETGENLYVIQEIDPSQVLINTGARALLFDQVLPVILYDVLPAGLQDVAS